MHHGQSREEAKTKKNENRGAILLKLGRICNMYYWLRGMDAPEQS